MSDLAGVIDTHVHSFPDVIPRKLDDIELVQQAIDAGMRALILKSHVGSTAERAYLLRRMFPAIEVFGGLVLNDTVGGLNPAAVAAALKMGAAVIWMPTKSAANHHAHLQGNGALSAIDSAGKVLPEVWEILKLVVQFDQILATGHLSPKESEILVEAALEQGVRRICVTHPEWHVTRIPVETQIRWAKHPQVFFERCLVSTQSDMKGHVPFAEIVEQIRHVGLESTVLATDYGMPQYPVPVAGMRDYLARLTASGFSSIEIDLLCRANPARLLRMR